MQQLHKRRPLFTGAGHRRRHRAHRRHLHGHRLPLLCLRRRHGLRHREHWRSAHHHLDPRPGRHLLPHPLAPPAPPPHPRRPPPPPPHPPPPPTHHPAPPHLSRH